MSTVEVIAKGGSETASEESLQNSVQCVSILVRTTA